MDKNMAIEKLLHIDYVLANNGYQPECKARMEIKEVIAFINSNEPGAVSSHEAGKEVCDCLIPTRDTINPDLCAYCGGLFIEPQQTDDFACTK